MRRERRGTVVTKGEAATRGATRRDAASSTGGSSEDGRSCRRREADRHLEERCGAEERWRARQRGEEARGELRRREKRRRDSNMARERRRERMETAAHWRDLFASGERHSFGTRASCTGHPHVPQGGRSAGALIITCPHVSSCPHGGRPSEGGSNPHTKCTKCMRPQLHWFTALCALR